MGKSKPYNGHRNWNHWNVALWISNDEDLYNIAKSLLKDFKNSKEAAAEEFIREAHQAGVFKTRDGAPFTKTSVLAALRGLE